MQYSNIPTALAICITAGIPVFVWGPRGDGKSSVIKATCRALGKHFIDKRCAQMDALDGPGLPYVDADGRTAYALPRWLPTQPDVVVVFDELPQAPMLTLNSLSEFILDRTMGGGDSYTAPSDVGIVAAGNRRQDKCGTIELPNHIKNRFLHLYPELDPQAWTINNMGGFPEPSISLPSPEPADFERARALVSAFIRVRPDLLSVFGQNEMATNESASPRTWEYVQRVLPYIFDNDALQLDMVRGCVGEGPAIEFTAFVRTATRMPNPDLCLSDPRNAPVPDRSTQDGVSITYALCAALISRVHAKNNDNFFIYISRLAPDFGFMACKDLMSRSPGLENCREGIKFFFENSKFMK